MLIKYYYQQYIMEDKITFKNIEYHLKYLDNGNILLEKINDIVINDINKIKEHNFTKSKIIYCKINDDEHNKLKYHSILHKIYEIIECGTKIIINTELNIKTIKKYDEGFNYIENLGISIQNVDSNKCIYEIVKQSIKNNIKISMKIQLYDTKNVIHIIV